MSIRKIACVLDVQQFRSLIGVNGEHERLMFGMAVKNMNSKLFERALQCKIYNVSILSILSGERRFGAAAVDHRHDFSQVGLCCRGWWKWWSPT